MDQIGRSVRREEDRRLTTGRGRYVSDIVEGNMVQLAFVRSSRAHARITGLDFTKAQSMPGVVGIFGPKDMGEAIKPLSFGPPPESAMEPTMPCPLADGVVRHVGEPVAVVVADNRYIAEAAADACEVEYETLPAVADVQEARKNQVLVYPERGTNVAAVVTRKTGDGEAALKRAAHIVQETFTIPRVVGHPMEPRAVVASFDPVTGRLTVEAATQGAHTVKMGLAAVLDLAPEKIRVVVPDVGGGFGVKNRIYSEDAVAAWLAIRLGRPVKWAGDRLEEFLATNQGRDQVHTASLGVDEEGRIVALADHFLQNVGAYTPEPLIVPAQTATCLPGPYRLPNFEATVEVVFTHTPACAPYRGAGQPEATFVMERLLDRAADAVGIGRDEIRRRNLVRPEDMPYENGIIGRDRQPVTFREGDFPGTLETVVEALRVGTSPDDGKLRGTGIIDFMEVSGGVLFEICRLELGRDGVVSLFTGTSSQGQGHRTSWAQIAADRLQVPMDQVRVVEADTDTVPMGLGTFASRSTITAGNAIVQAVAPFLDKCREEVAALWEASPEDVLWEDGFFRLAGVADRAMDLRTLAVSRPLDAPLVEASAQFMDANTSFGMGCHGVRVAVDPETFQISIEDYVICHDAGVRVNPLLAEGQVFGGTVQGLGTAWYEALRFDAQGQPLNTSFMDYLVPGSAEMPDFRLVKRDFPSSSNPEGLKGLGEGGTTAAGAAFASAVEDALRPFGVKITSLPVTPASIFAQVKGGVRP